MTAGRSLTARAWAEVDAAALAHNIACLRRFLAPPLLGAGGGGPRFLAVVKSNAYGHGVDLIAPLCAEHGITDFGVATVDEGIHLRSLVPPSAAIYLIAPTLPEDAPDVVLHRLTPFVSDLALGRALSQAAQAQGTVAAMHLEVDTGIGRAGVGLSDAQSLLKALDALPSLRVTGLATHFASADEDASDAYGQHALFADLIGRLGDRTDSLLIHAGNSPASLVIPGAWYGLVRPGLLLYGIEPAPGMFADAGLDLRPVLSVRARVLLCRPLPAGATISYGRTYTVPAGGGLYATIAIGYGDGWPRRLSNRGHVLLHGRRAPLRGRVCMDQLVADVSDIPNVRAGDIATLLGTDGPERLTAAALAAQVQTTPHEITTCLTTRLPRVLLAECGI